MVEAFDVTRVSANPARFDLKKAEAINATHLRALPVEEFIERVVPVPRRRPAWSADPPTRGAASASCAAIAPAGPGADDRAVRGRRPARLPVRRRRRDRPGRRGEAARRRRTPPRCSTRRRRRCATCADWSTPAIEEALKAALVEGLGRKPRQAFGPVRVAISGRTVSPPLYESIELLGRERTLARLAAARAVAERPPAG